MKIILKTGADKLVFGMKQKDVTALYGTPDRQFNDEEKNIIYLYNDKKLRLTFYADEDFKLGYIISSHPQLELGTLKIMNQPWDALEAKLAANKLVAFEKETFDSADNYFNEANWVIFQVEFGEVIRVEIGAAINNKDEFDWKF